MAAYAARRLRCFIQKVRSTSCNLCCAELTLDDDGRPGWPSNAVQPFQSGVGAHGGVTHTLVVLVVPLSTPGRTARAFHALEPTDSLSELDEKESDDVDVDIPSRYY